MLLAKLTLGFGGTLVLAGVYTFHEGSCVLMTITPTEGTCICGSRPRSSPLLCTWFQNGT
jgi:hypothetical protein